MDSGIPDSENDALHRVLKSVRPESAIIMVVPDGPKYQACLIDRRVYDILNAMALKIEGLERRIKKMEWDF